ncbi:MAG: peptidylprolyl isomerase [Planctomycetota bacterium]|jgi:peptidyl-prolyl cis-trans isomerase B (cyclophilin B)
MRTLRALLPLAIAVALSGLPGTDAGERPDYVLTLRTSKTSVALGEEIPFEVELKKLRGKPVEVNALRLARNSVSITVARDDLTHRITRIYGEIREAPDGLTREVKDHPPRKSTVKRGKPLVLSLPLLAIRAGKLEFRADYAGGSPVPPDLRSETVEVEVVLPEGKREVAAVMETSKGSMVFTFWPDRAFNTVLNFLTLAHSGRYDGLTFHRIIDGFLVQGGDPLGDGGGGPGWFIPAELSPDIEQEKGVISMARTPRVPDSAGSQFFVLLEKQESLKGKYAAFGRVVEGIEVLEKLAKVETEPTGERSRPLVPPLIRKVRVITR